jgi:hypothetical protein
LELFCLKHVIFLAGDMGNSMGWIMYISFGDYLVRPTAKAASGRESTIEVFVESGWLPGG